MVTKKSSFDFESPDTNDECPAERCYVKVVTPRGTTFDVQIDVVEDGISVKAMDYYGLHQVGSDIIAYDSEITPPEKQPRRKRNKS